MFPIESGQRCGQLKIPVTSRVQKFWREKFAPAMHVNFAWPHRRVLTAIFIFANKFDVSYRLKAEVWSAKNQVANRFWENSGIRKKFRPDHTVDFVWDFDFC